MDLLRMRVHVPSCRFWRESYAPRRGVRNVCPSWPLGIVLCLFLGPPSCTKDAGALAAADALCKVRHVEVAESFRASACSHPVVQAMRAAKRVRVYRLPAVSEEEVAEGIPQINQTPRSGGEHGRVNLVLAV